MPIYEYQCKKCGKQFESLVMGGREPKKCEFCGSKSIQKLMSACAFQTKDKSGLVTKSTAAGSSCSGCTSSSCSSCS